MFHLNLFAYAKQRATINNFETFIYGQQIVTIYKSTNNNDNCNTYYVSTYLNQHVVVKKGTKGVFAFI